MNPLPKQFKIRIQNLYGEDGNKWLINLPTLRASLLERWSLQNSQPVGRLSYNYLESAHSPEYGPVILKIGYPNPELVTEIKALNYYQGSEVAVSLLDWDMEHGALLLERILPGQNLTSLSDDQEATRIAAHSAHALRQPHPGNHDFPTIEKWCQGFHRYQSNFKEGGGPLPKTLFSNANDLVWELLESSEEQCFLHGDLHHNNLLLREDNSWIVIDPKGVTGEFACEVGPYLYNPVPDLLLQPNLRQILDHRLQILEETTGVDKKRLAAWSYCRAVLSAIWSVEEGDFHLDYGIEIAEMIRNLIK